VSLYFGARTIQEEIGQTISAFNRLDGSELDIEEMYRCMTVVRRLVPGVFVFSNPLAATSAISYVDERARFA
jgi:hypothetical protein